MTVLFRLSVLALALSILEPMSSSAQDNSSTPGQIKAVAASSDQSLRGDQPLRHEELEALVVPIALYPDNLLSLVLMASTYPLEIVQADRWMKDNKKLKGDELKTNLDKQPWDENVKALGATPDVLAMMSAKLEWTTKLGNALLAQQADVMDAIQRLRSRADANNKLSSTKEQRVEKREEQGKRIISIESTDPNVVYVPYYDPAVVYGEWPYPAYPPYYFGYPSYIGGGFIAAGLAFGAGYALGRWASGGNYWGGNFNWNNNNININRPQINPLGGNNWQHRPEHRQGARYDNPRVQQKFGNRGIADGAQNRMDFRGRNGDQVLKPGGGDRPGGAQRPSAGQRPSGDRVTTGKRPSSGNAKPSQRPSSSKQGTKAKRSGGNALGNVGSSGRVANRSSARGSASMGGRSGGGGARGGGGGRGGVGRGGGRGGGGGRRGDLSVGPDIVRLENPIDGLCGTSCWLSDGSYTGVIAQELQQVVPQIYGHASYQRDSYGRDTISIRLRALDAYLPAVAQMSPSQSHPSACNRGSHAQDRRLIDASGNSLYRRKCTADFQHA